MRKIIFIALLSYMASQHVQAENLPLGRNARVSSNFKKCAKAKLGNCDFYTDCLEKYYPCGKKGYAIAYGDKYCRRFNELNGTAYFKKWIARTTKDLQTSIISYVDKQKGKIQCKNLAEAAFDSHPDAYLKLPTDVCKIDRRTLVGVVGTVDRGDRFEARSLKQIVIVGATCMKRWLKIDQINPPEQYYWWKEVHDDAKQRLGTCCKIERLGSN